MERRTRQSGFTLVELQVVVIIIGILAAIAIPVFLAQREKAWRAQINAALKNAATAEESYITEADEYTDDVSDLAEKSGLKYAETVELSIPVAVGEARYCIEAEHSSLGETWHYASGVGRPSEGDCP